MLGMRRTCMAQSLNLWLSPLHAPQVKCVTPPGSQTKELATCKDWVFDFNCKHCWHFLPHCCKPIASSSLSSRLLLSACMVHPALSSDGPAGPSADGTERIFESKPSPSINSVPAHLQGEVLRVRDATTTNRHCHVVVAGLCMCCWRLHHRSPLHRQAVGLVPLLATKEACSCSGELVP